MFRRFLLTTWALAALAGTPAVAQTTGEPVTLRAALVQARAQSPALRASAARVEAAELSRSFAGRLLNPVTEFRWENMAPGLRDTLPLDVFATVSQPIELGGKRAARRGLAAATAEGARASLWTTERSLDQEIARLFLSVIRERERGRTLTEQATGLTELVRVLERRVAEGTTAEADLRKLETERARVETDAAVARIAARRELTTLGALVGWVTPPSLDALERPAVALPASSDAEAAIAAAVERRADVRLAITRLDASRQGLKFERARGIPDLNITGGFKRTGGYDTSVIAVLLPVPIFERNRANIALSQGSVTVAELELDQARRVAAAEARGALAAARELAQRTDEAASRLVAPATIVRDAARAAFTAGAGDLLRLVDAERVYADARLAVTELTINAVLASIEARLALAEDVLP